MYAIIKAVKGDEKMIYIINGYSQYDYEIKNIVFGIFTDKKQAEYQKAELEKIQASNGTDEMILYITEYELNSLVDKNIKNYLFD